jgi:hypothetical protein
MLWLQVTIHDYSIRVQQLPQDATADELVDFFGQYGEVGTKLHSSLLLRDRSAVAQQLMSWWTFWNCMETWAAAAAATEVPSSIQLR